MIDHAEQVREFYRKQGDLRTKNRIIDLVKLHMHDGCQTDDQQCPKNQVLIELLNAIALKEN